MTPQIIAQWMLEELKQVNFLYQETVVYNIKSEFGDQFTYINENGNLAIDRKVLKEFRKLTNDTVVWDRGELCWRFRQDYDIPNKRQAE